MASHFIVECLDCGFSTPFFPTSTTCPRCGCGWREALYDYSNLAVTLPLQLPGRPFDVWRYAELLPVRDHNPDLSLGEGGTPLIRAGKLGNMLQCPNIYIKDERQNPTFSFKDRQAMVTISALLESGISEMVLASTGNLALAYSAYAARAGIKLWAFLTSRVPPEKIREIQLYGTRLIQIAGSFEQTRQEAQEFARQRNVFMDQASQTVPSVEAMKTIAFETTEQLTAAMGPPPARSKTKPSSAWRAPDWFLQSVSLGLGPLGILKGFSELRIMNLIDRTPSMGMIQPQGCAPMASAWLQGSEVAEAVTPVKTRIESLASADPGRAYTLLRHRMEQESGGAFEVVSDEEAFRAQQLLAQTEGMTIEPAAAVAFAGLIKLCNNGIIKEKDVIVVNCTGHTMNVGDHHSRTAIPGQTLDPMNKGVLASNFTACLLSINPNQYSKILIAHEDPKLTRLLSLFLGIHSDAEVFEASEYNQIIRLAQSECIDLLFLDLHSPIISAFSILDTFASRSDCQIPFIIGLLPDTVDEIDRETIYEHIRMRAAQSEKFNSQMIEELKDLFH